MSWLDKLNPFSGGEDKSATINDEQTLIEADYVDPSLFPENSINYTPAYYAPYGEYEELYLHNWLAKHIIDFPIEDSFGQWREWPDKYKRRLEKEEKRLKYKAKIIDSLTTADIYGGSLVVMFVNGQTDMSSPLDLSAIRRGDLLRIEIFDPWMVNKVDIEETNPLSDRYLLPNYYEIAGAKSNGKFHHSRCIELHGLELPRVRRRLVGNAQMNWGQSRLEPLKETVKDYIATDSAISKLIKRLAVFFVKEPGVSHARTTKAFNRIAQAVANVARNISVHGIYYGDMKSDIGSINANISGVANLLEIKQENVSGAGEIAVTRLFGKAKAGMSGDTNDGDIRNYQGYLIKYRNRKIEKLEPLEEVLIRSALGSNPDDCECEWGEISVHTETEKAEINLKNSQAKEAEAKARTAGKEDKGAENANS